MSQSSSSTLITQKPDLRLTHFGAAGWAISDGRSTILLDPYLSRIRFKGRKYGPTDATEGEDTHSSGSSVRRCCRWFIPSMDRLQAAPGSLY
jgi:L-ascorbate metabolism protein UlaG (beta-lactamase superfamily)